MTRPKAPPGHRSFSAAPRRTRRLALLVLALAVSGPAPAQFIRLEDVVAGGDGSGNAPPENTGIDPRNGAFTTDYFAGRITDTDGVNPSPVPGSPYIDSVFLLKGKVPTADDGCNGCFVQYITRSGVQLWLDDSEETDSGWNYILKDRVGGVSEPGIRVGGVDFTTSVGLHASMGITFDLEALRARHGDAAVGCFSAFWGMDDCSIGYVTLRAMVSNDAGGVSDIRVRSFSAGEGEFLSIEIPRTARYLTLVSASTGLDNCDHGTFARPIITPDPCPEPRYSWVWSIAPTRVAPQGELIALRGEHLDLLFTVLVGGLALQNQSAFSPSFYTGTTAPLAPGFYDLEIIEQVSGSYMKFPHAIEVAPPPELTAFLPSEVLEDRPMPVSILGRNLRSDMIVEVDDVGSDGVAEDIGGLTFVSESQMVGSTPRSARGFSPEHRFSPDVLIYDQERLHIFSGLVTYVGTGIEKVEPSTVSTEGGTTVTFVGAGFAPGMTYTLGGVAAGGVVLIDAGHARGVSPPLPEGFQDAQLLSSAGTLIYTRQAAVQAVSPGPLAIASVSPPRVFSLGGAKVTIVTTRPHGNVVPRVGGMPLAGVESLDALTLRGEIAPLAPGSKDVDLVAAVDGGEEVIAAAPGAIQVIADDQIRITAVDPPVVSTLGGTEVTISGSGFSPGFVPRIGGAPLESMELLSGTLLRGVTPPVDPGLHPASIGSGPLELAVLPGAVTAAAPGVPPGMYIGHIRPARISRSASRVRFVGTQFSDDLVPRIGGVPLSGIDHPSPCRIEGLAPDLPPGFHRADLFRPGFGVVARFDEMVEVADPGAPPRPAYLVSEPVRRDGSTRVFVFGNDYSDRTVITVGGRPLVDAVVASDELIVGRAPALDPGEAVGLRDIVAADERGSSRLASGLRYVDAGDGGTRFVRADVDANGQVELTDAINVLGFLFLGNPPQLGCLEAADADASGTVELTDAVYLLQFLFLGGRKPPAPYPDCGVPAQSLVGCASSATCGTGGSGGAGEDVPGGASFLDNVKLLEESPAQEADARVVEIAAEEGEIVIHDPPGGKDVQVGDVIAGFTPIRSEAVHNGVAYMLKVEQEIAGSCLAASGGDKVFKVRPATLGESVVDGGLRLELTDLFGARVAQADRLSPVLDCLTEIGGGGGVEPGEGVFFDVDFGSFGLLDLHDGDNYLNAGFYQSQVRYNSGINLGVGIGAGKLTRLTFFAGQLLESQVEFYVDAGLFTQIHKEVKLLHLHKGTIVFIGPVPILVTAAIALYAGVNLDAGVTLYVDAGTAASYKAGIGFEFDGTSVRNISGFEPPKLSALPDTPVVNVDGFASVRGYIRPEFKVGAGLLIKALTGDIYMITELSGRAHVEGHTSPPCFQWGFDAGAKVTLQTEVQLFGYDLFDRTFDPVNEEWPNLLGGQIGCKAPPVVKLNRTLETTPTGLLIHLDASESYDPDGGPLRFRWDLNDDGKCMRNTGQDPRTTFAVNPDNNPCGGITCEHVIRLRVTDDEGTYTERTTSFTTVGVGGQLFRSDARVP
jgi:PKD domain-containing protein/IPT/TIG domain-containing protein/NPCBM/NEW2 domain-containing protein